MEQENNVDLSTQTGTDVSVYSPGVSGECSNQEVEVQKNVVDVLTIVVDDTPVVIDTVPAIVDDTSVLVSKTITDFDSANDPELTDTTPFAFPKVMSTAHTFNKFGTIVSGVQVTLVDGTVLESNENGHVEVPVGEEVTCSDGYVVK